MGSRRPRTKNGSGSSTVRSSPSRRSSLLGYRRALLAPDAVAALMLDPKVQEFVRALATMQKTG